MITLANQKDRNSQVPYLKIIVQTKLSYMPLWIRFYLRPSTRNATHSLTRIPRVDRKFNNDDTYINLQYVTKEWRPQTTSKRFPTSSEHISSQHRHNTNKSNRGNTIKTLNAMQEHTTSILFTCVGVLAFATCVVFGIWYHKAWINYGFHVTDFKKFDAELRRTCSETTQMREDVELDHTADCLTKIRNAELLAAADDCDNGLRIALAAWEDIMNPEEWNLDIESKGDSMLKGRRSQGRFVIKLMRRKCFKGFEKRRRMEKELQSNYNEVMSR